MKGISCTYIHNIHKFISLIDLRLWWCTFSFFHSVLTSYRSQPIKLSENLIEGVEYDANFVLQWFKGCNSRGIGATKFDAEWTNKGGKYTVTLYYSLKSYKLLTCLLLFHFKLYGLSSACSNFNGSWSSS